MNLSKFICVFNRALSIKLPPLSPRKEEIRGGELIIEVVCDKSAHSVCVFLRKKLKMGSMIPSFLRWVSLLQAAHIVSMLPAQR